MDNLTQVSHSNYSLPDNPIKYLEEYNNSVGRLIMLLSPLLFLTVWVNFYLVFKLILYLTKLYYTCVNTKNNATCAGEIKCKKGCENCVGNIFLQT